MSEQLYGLFTVIAIVAVLVGFSIGGYLVGLNSQRRAYDARRRGRADWKQKTSLPRGDKKRSTI